MKSESALMQNDAAEDFNNQLVILGFNMSTVYIFLARDIQSGCPGRARS